MTVDTKLRKGLDAISEENERRLLEDTLKDAERNVEAALNAHTCFYITVRRDRVPARKRACIKTILEVLANEAPDYPQPTRVDWFMDLDDDDFALMDKHAWEFGLEEFYDYSTAQPILGVCFRAISEIWLHRDLDGNEMIRVFGHELGHLAGAESEEMADRFAGAILRKFGGRTR